MDADTEPPSEPLRQTATRQLMSWVAIGAAVLAAFWLVAMIIDAVAALVTGTYEHLVRLPKVPRDTFWAWFAVYSGLVALTGLVVARARRLRLVFNQLIWSIAAVVIPLLMLTWPVSYTSVSGEVSCGSYQSWNDSSSALNDVCVEKLESRSRWALTVGALGIVGPIAWLYREVRREERAAGARRGDEDL